MLTFDTTTIPTHHRVSPLYFGLQAGGAKITTVIWTEVPIIYVVQLARKIQTPFADTSATSTGTLHKFFV